MKTYGGIELDIKQSEYRYNYLGHTFYFSSATYLTKFNKLVDEFINMETMKLYTKYKVRINANLYFAIVLYKRIEKRGFYIVDNLSNNSLDNNQEFQIYKI